MSSNIEDVQADLTVLKWLPIGTVPISLKGIKYRTLTLGGENA